MESNIRTCVRLQYFGIKETKIKVYKYFVAKEVQQKIIFKKASKSRVVIVRLEMLFDVLKH